MTEEYDLLREEYEEYKIKCEIALDIVETKISGIRKLTYFDTHHDIYHSFSKRIKTFESVVEKCERRGYDLTIESIRRNIKDIAGLRLITLYKDEIYDLVKILHGVHGFNISADGEKDYVKARKASGYASYHLSVQIEIQSPVTGGTELIPVEIQIRTELMNAWAVTEHDIKYKDVKASPEAKELFKRASESQDELEDALMKLRDMKHAEALSRVSEDVSEDTSGKPHWPWRKKESDTVAECS